MIKQIHLLDDATINKIAAGEVVERPSSVVKELVENSIDANSSTIIIEIKDGGKELIRITDNGDGIDDTQVEKSFLRHATSKITSVDDLYDLHSLGFRGEALASIASISKISIITKTKENSIGTKVSKEGAKEILKENIGCASGTTLIVEDLFFNVPARKKFLKTSLSETIAISDIINKLIIGNPSIKFKYINNNKIMSTSPGNNDLKSAIRSVYGTDISQNLIPIDIKNDLFELSGYIGNNSIYKNNKSLQYVYVNNRYVQSKLVQSALSDSYKSIIPINKHAVCFLNLYINPSKIDVNIHPTKLEIKFDEEEAILKSLQCIIEDALLNSSLIPSYKSPKEEVKKEAKKIELPNMQNKIKSNIVKKQEKQESFNTISSFNNTNKIKQNIDLPLNIKSTDNRKSENIVKEKDFTYSPKMPDISIIGTLFNTYILGQYENDFYLIDQHAAHERVRYEKYLNQFENQTLSTQILLNPIVITLSNTEILKIQHNIDIFKKFGFEIEVFGNNSIIVREVPNLFGEPQSKNFIMDIIDNIDQLKSNYDLKKDAVASIACKGAIKAKDRVGDLEIKQLLYDLKKCENSFTCPHGRPIIVKMSKLEIEKLFKRVL